MNQNTPHDNISEPTSQSDDNSPALTGPLRIAEYVKTLPDNPGVYRMIDDKDTVLYVGKAKSLVKRVSAYKTYNQHPIRIQRMIRATQRMEFVTTSSEAEALLLEATLIKRLKPRYNILLRDDKSFPYILVRKNHPAGQIRKHRGARKIKGDYYGPFASASAVNRTLDTLQRAFRLRTCSDSVYEARTRPCMLHQIKRCAAPCTGEISIDEYNKLIDEASDFLNGRSNDLRKNLQGQMQIASKALAFEKAAEIRDRLQALAKVSTHSDSNPQSFSEGDVFALHMSGGQSCIQAFFFRAGQNWGTRAFFPRHSKDDSAEDILDSFLAQFYLHNPIPRNIFVSHDVPSHELIEKALSERSERKIKIAKPQRGEKLRLIEKAMKNAEDALSRKRAETASQLKLLKGVSEAFDLDGPPERIEIYDNSHIQGTNAIGAFVVAGPDGFNKRDYRTFNIKDLDTMPGDDYAMMREVFRRRFSRLMKDETLIWPDLILIDGGKGQLSAVTETFEALGILGRVPLVSIAKGPDRNAGREVFFMNDRPSFMMPPRDPILFYLQRLRDEAHRFAIGTHVARRKKQMKTNPLDGIVGIGAKRKRELLAHFGSAKEVKSASRDDLARVQGISETLAEVIYDYFNTE